MKTRKEKTFPIEWEGWDQVDVLTVAFYNVKFTEAFGCFEQGDTFRSISVNYDEGIIEAYDDAGAEVLKTQEFCFSPKN